MKELIDLRKPREKHFLNEDGTITLNMYNEDVHYKKGNEYIEIDNNLIEDNNKIINKENDFKVNFSKDKFLVNIVENDNYINISLEDNNLVNDINYQDNYIIYKNILPNIDIKYNLVGKTAKETIIVNSKIDGLDKIKFNIDTNLELVIQDNKVIAIDSNGEKIYEFIPPYMIDDKQEFMNCYYELEKLNSKYLLTLVMDKEWLDNALYPVLIDPTITGENSTVYDTYIYPGDTNVNRNSHEYLKVGVDSNNVKYRALVKFELPKIGTGSQVIKATAHFTSYKDDYYPSGQHLTSLNKNATVHQVTQDWTETQANWNTMNNKYNEMVEGYSEMRRGVLEYSGGTIGSVTLGVNDFDITSLVKKWYSGVPNYGIMLKWVNETKDANCKEYYLYSKDNKAVSSGVISTNPKPVLVIQYRNQNGKLDYMSYDTIGFSNGASNVNNYNGNVVNIFNVNETVGGNNNLSVGVIYNTNDVILNNNYNVALGFRINYDERISLKTINTTNDYIEYLSGDGAVHYFYKASDGSYVSEDGLGLTIKLENADYVMEEKYGNKYYFINKNNTYYLYKTIAKDNKQVSIKRDTNNRIIEIANDDNQKISVTYESNKINFKSDNEESSILIENGKLKAIENIQGLIQFSYNEKNIISEIKDVTGIKVVYDYYETIPYRLKKVTQYGLNNEEGKSKTFTYSFNATTITDNLNHKMRYTFNDLGNTIGTVILSDDNTLKNSYGFSESYVGKLKMSDTNKPLSTSVPIKYGENLIKNASFETEEDNGFMYYRNKVKGHTGDYCALIDGDAYGEILGILEGENSYVFSAYFKNANKIEINITGTTVDKTVLLATKMILSNDDFMRCEIPFDIYEQFVSNIGIEIIVDNGGTAYMDDMQLERGSVASPFNFMENSNFEEGIGDWNVSSYNEEDEKQLSNPYEIVTLNSSEKALKIKSNVDFSIIADNSINISGKKGDVYTFSFWYKNEGVLNTDLEYVGNMVTLDFYNSTEEEEGGHGTYNTTLNYHADEWQFFTETYIAENYYESIDLRIFSIYEANGLYITNMSLVKDLGSYYYTYDEEGNLISTYDIAKNKTEFKYDKNNQLMGMFNPKGNNYKYEYDNVITDRILKGISPTGISNEIKYDSFGNPIKTLINNISANTGNNEFYIRAKGTDKYIAPNMDTKELLLKNSVCNRYAFKLTKSNDDNMLFLSSLSDYAVCNVNNKLVLVKNGNAIIFNIINNANGSVSLKVKNQELYLRFNNDSLVLAKKTQEDYTFEFYLEDVGSELKIEESAIYSEDGKFINKTIDALGNETVYDIDESSGLINSITNAMGQKTNYEYNNKKQIESIFNDNKRVNYTYENNLLSSIKTGNKNYTFTYDNFLNQKEVKINDNLLSRNVYDVNNGNLLEKQYGNNKVIKYEYDKFNRLSKYIKSDTVYDYFYNNFGNLAKINEVEYKYDFANRLSEIIKEDIFKVTYKYDVNNNVSSKTQSLYMDNHKIEYTYNEDDSVVKVQIDDDIINNNYDYLGRLDNKNINGRLITEYTYKTRGDKTSLLVDTMKIGNDLYKYTYDNVYNIKSIALNGVVINEYKYDSRNQLIEDSNYKLNRRYKITYDNEGNILSKDVYEITSNKLISSDKYEYNNSTWEDQLTNYNNEEITYDAIGNPITIGNKNLTWQNGRELASIDEEVKYYYNEDGIRVRKVVGNHVVEYHLEGKEVVFETRESDKLYYIRDEANRLIGVVFNGNKYYYKKNNQRDIIGIYDSNYNLVVEYQYDVYGKVISIKDNTGKEITNSNHIGKINPYRYRSYYYDEESGYYYLNSRYYNPEWGRFLNADGIIGTSSNIDTYNLYSYVENNFVNKFDENGNFAIPLVYAGYYALGMLAAYTVAKLAPEAIRTSVAVAGSIVNTLEEAVANVKEKITEKTDIKSVTKTFDNKIKKGGKTYIYRFGKANPGNLTPKEKDIKSGLSFSLAPQAESVMTTIEDLNSTGVVYAVIDGPNHVSVYPIGGSMRAWINQGANSIWTEAVKSKVVKWDGVIR